MTSTTPLTSGSELSFPTIVLPVLRKTTTAITRADINTSLINTMKSIGYGDVELADFIEIFQRQATDIIALIGQRPAPAAAASPDAPVKAIACSGPQLASFLNDASYGIMVKYGEEPLTFTGEITHGKGIFVPDFVAALTTTMDRDTQACPLTVAELWTLCTSFGKAMSHSALFLPVMRAGNPEILKKITAEFSASYVQSTKSKTKSASPVATAEKRASMWTKFTSKLKTKDDAEITLTVPANTKDNTNALAHWAALEPSMQTSLLACNSIVAFLEEAKKAKIVSTTISSILYALMGKEQCTAYTS
jgi:hypothetical protein